MTALPFTEIVAGLPATVPFVGPETQERGRGTTFDARLGANESAFGPSPRAVEAMAAAAADVWQYADPENHDLKTALSAQLGVSADRLSVGEGIDGLLGLIVRMFCGEGTPVVASAGSYPTFQYHVNGFGGRMVLVPYADDHEDPDALVTAARASGAPLVYFANPDNPMGTWHSAARVRAMIEALPEGCLLCLDEAYCEFAPPGTLLPDEFEHPQLIRLRTFSKAHGMAGARVGYALTSEAIASAFNKVRNHFGVNKVAQAGAVAALADTAHLRSVVTATERSKARIGDIARAAGLTPLPSATNFVALDTGRDGDFARKLVVALGDRGIFVRMPFVAPQDRCIRVTAAPDASLDVLDARLSDAVAAIS
ncbi:MAG: pyridoxal phosphate-dependent aminotransferase [Pseudomonadota bacterium]